MCRQLRDSTLALATHAYAERGESRGAVGSGHVRGPEKKKHPPGRRVLVGEVESVAPNGLLERGLPRARRRQARARRGLPPVERTAAAARTL